MNTATTKNVSPRNDRHMDFVERMKWDLLKKTFKKIWFQYCARGITGKPRHLLGSTAPVFFKKMIVEIQNVWLMFFFFWKTWKEKTVTKSNQIPRKLYGLKKFFHHASPKPRGGILYVNIWILTNLTHQNLMDKTSWWLNHERMSRWEAATQLEATEFLDRCCTLPTKWTGKL